jgi:hypothetical protein
MIKVKMECDKCGSHLFRLEYIDYGLHVVCKECKRSLFLSVPANVLSDFVLYFTLEEEDVK